MRVSTYPRLPTGGYACASKIFPCSPEVEKKSLSRHPPLAVKYAGFFLLSASARSIRWKRFPPSQLSRISTSTGTPWWRRSRTLTDCTARWNSPAARVSPTRSRCAGFEHAGRNAITTRATLLNLGQYLPRFLMLGIPGAGKWRARLVENLRPVVAHHRVVIPGRDHIPVEFIQPAITPASQEFVRAAGVPQQAGQITGGCKALCSRPGSGCDRLAFVGHRSHGAMSAIQLFHHLRRAGPELLAGQTRLLINHACTRFRARRAASGERNSDQACYCSQHPR